MNPDKRRQIFERLAAARPDPRSELEHQTPFELLVAVVLSAQATDRSVNVATAKLYPVANTPAAIARLGVDGLIPYISSIGLYNTKAKNVVALAEILLREHGGEVPREREALEKLPGVGRKTANVVLNVAFGEPTLAVDTHVFRVANRIGLARGDDPLAVELKLLATTPPQFLHNAHHWLILHGRYVCVARLPKCPECPIVDLCEYKHKTPPADTSAPRKRKPPPPPALIEAARRPRTSAKSAATSKRPAAPRAKAPSARPGSPVGSGRRRGGRGA